MNHKLSSQAVITFLILLLIILHPHNAMAQHGRFRVTLTGFFVNHATVDDILQRDGAGDEVYVMVNFAELAPSNRIFGALRNRESVNYGDTSGPATPFGQLRHIQPFSTIKAGSSSGTGGLLTGDRYPPPGENPTDPSGASPDQRGRFLPMVLWEGELRRDISFPNAVLLIPTIWENDYHNDIVNIWIRQVNAYMTRFAANSARFITGTARRPLVQQVDTVLSVIPHRNDFDRPVGMSGDGFNPLAASPNPATFIPAVMLLTFNSAQEAAASTTNSSTHGRGVIEITYRDGESYGPGSYTIFLLVEQLPNS